MTTPTDPPALYIGPAAVEPAVLPLPRGGVSVALGFPSPAEDFQEDTLDLSTLLIRNPLASYIYQASGNSMIGVGILDKDFVVVDRSIKPRHGDVVMAVWDGNEPTCKILQVAPSHIELHSANPEVPVIVLDPETEVEIFTVYSSARLMRRGPAPRAGRS